MPQGLGELEEHGVPEGWHGFWHGRRDAISAIETPASLSELDDAELLDYIRDNIPSLSVHDLDAGAILVNPEKNFREYRGIIRIHSDPEGNIAFEGVTQYGRSGQVSGHSRVVYRGKSLREAAAAVNERIEKKLRGGYELEPGKVGQVDSSVARQNVEELCRVAAK